MDKTRQRARRLRKDMTPAERKLWGCLRKESLQGFRFHRQAPIGPFVADFLCRERRLVIEVDGATHGEPHEVASDERRSAFLKSQGYAVHRVNNEDVYRNISGTLDTILQLLEARPVFYAKNPIRPSATFPCKAGEGPN